ncbi:unnamed protein product [Gordionus sp. m RMFG-2023]|uniref:tetratricopeptide repeat protein 4-like n=1 Tax=Gordionus sp. m RMFG-2023 TaxID=3053472 RepID=UPI0030E2F32D
MQKFTEENWTTELEKHPIFRTKPILPGEELPELFQALQAIKYEDNDISILVQNYKEDGDHNLKQKYYEPAVQSYTKAINLKYNDNVLNSILYSNRATANYLLNNFGSCLKDAEKSLSLNPNYLKPLYKAILSSLKLEKYQKAFNLCKERLDNLENLSKEDIAFLQEKQSITSKKLSEIQNAKNLVSKKLVLKVYILNSLKTAFLVRKIRVFDQNSKISNYSDDKLWENFTKIDTNYPFLKSPLSITDNYSFSSNDHITKSYCESDHIKPEFLDLIKSEGEAYLYLEQYSANSNSSKYLCSNILHWPVTFVYPQYQQYDLIIDFCENDDFIYHLSLMFPPTKTNDVLLYPQWDSKTEYTIDNLDIYWEDKFAQRLVKINFKDLTLRQALYPETNEVILYIQEPLLTFIILPRTSDFTQKYLKNYSIDTSSSKVIMKKT